MGGNPVAAWLSWAPACLERPSAATKTSCPQISQIYTDFQRKGRRQKEKTMDSGASDPLVLSPFYFFPSSLLGICANLRNLWIL
jgi:hypothetical protein